MSGRTLSLVGGYFLFSDASLWLQYFPASPWRGILRLQVVTAALGEAQTGHLSADVGKDPVLLAVGDFEELKLRLVTEKETPPSQNSPILRALAKSSHLIHGKMGPHPEFGRLQIQAGLQTPMVGQLGCWAFSAQSVFLQSRY